MVKNYKPLLMLLATSIFGLVSGQDITVGSILKPTEINSRYPFGTSPLLVITNNEQGTIGILMNRPISVGTAESLTKIICSRGNKKYFLGGLNNIYQPLAFNLPTENYLIDPFPITLDDSMLALLDSNEVCTDPRSHIFFGFEFWNPGQLQFELSSEFWELEVLDQ